MKKELRVQPFCLCAVWFCALLLTLAVSGCSSRFDAGGYVTAVLDNFYLDNSEKLIEISDIPTEEAHQTYLDGLSSEAQIFYGYLSFRSIAVDEHTEERVTRLYAQIYDRARYEIESAKKSGNAYSVVVRISPIDIFERSKDELSAFAQEFYARIAKGEFANKGEIEMNAEFQDSILTLLEGKISSIGYLDPVEVTVQVTPDEQGRWGISNEDFQRIDTEIIRY